MMIAENFNDFVDKVSEAERSALNSPAGQELTQKLLEMKLAQNPNMTPEEWAQTKSEFMTFMFTVFVQEVTAYGAKTVELKYFYDDDDNQTETNVVDFMKLYSEELDKSYFIFRNELKVPSGTPRKFINYTEGQIFTTA